MFCRPAPPHRHGSWIFLCGNLLSKLVSVDVLWYHPICTICLFLHIVLVCQSSETGKVKVLGEWRSSLGFTRLGDGDDVDMNDDVGILRLLRYDMNNSSSSVEKFNDDVTTSPPGGRVPIISNANGQWNGGPSGITLQAIGLTLGGGLCVSFLSIVAFGLAVMARSSTIAPRCTTRHPNTIWRSRKDMYGENKDDDENDGDDDDDGEKKRRRRIIRDRAFSPLSFMPRDPKQSLTPELAQEEQQQNDSQNSNNEISKKKYEKHAQDRGNPFLGWIPWTLHLSYDRMLRGIPGTGTRDGGMGGKLLGVNLDAIVLFRYHGKSQFVQLYSMYRRERKIFLIIELSLTYIQKHYVYV